MKDRILLIAFLVPLVMGVLSCGKSTKSESESESADMTEASNPEETTAAVNTLTPEEKEEGWILLFNGENFNGWRGYGRQDMPAAWVIDGDAIKIKGSGGGEAGAEDGGDIIFDRQFQNFELKFEWKVSKGGNSGIFYLAREIEGQPIYRSAPEYQVLDNVNHVDAGLGKDGNRQSASLYDLIPAKPQNSKPVGEWNTGRVIVYKGTVVHSQNGENVLEYHLWTPEWESMIENSKFKGWTEMLNAGGEERQGYIGLQDHGDDIWFRNIKVKVLE